MPGPAPRKSVRPGKNADGKLLLAVYDRLLHAFGPQHWWPGQTPFEVMVGAVLTQNTNWGNVERAVTRLKNADLMAPHRLVRCPRPLLARLIRPAGYFNVKAKRLGNFLTWLHSAIHDSPAGVVQALRRFRTPQLRAQLLAVNGIGPETADSILLYALNRRVFVVDAYTRRFLLRHRLVPPSARYDDFKHFFQSNLPRSTRLYNEYHALIVRLGSECCRPKPRCAACPLRSLLGKPRLK